MEAVEKLPAQPWMTAPETVAVVAALSANGATVRFVGGCVRDALRGQPIKDIDIAYYDPDLSYEAEDKHIRRVRALLKDIPIELDVKNQARVHLWFADKFGYDMPPYPSIQTGSTASLRKPSRHCPTMTRKHGRFLRTIG